jgi:hypothetical protein
LKQKDKWTAELAPAQTIIQGSQTVQNNTTMITQVQKTTATPITGRTNKAFWYAPEIKRWVKTVEEYYGSNGVRNERYLSMPYLEKQNTQRESKTDTICQN